ncbi:hypothetical protein DID76_01685 [Candidatus Marinamargulisbacteria bacterium SCGC AG-414-C22]|nr:hypothetical protein DID76_01685 [Candidatus Marinamargulisbacteria bacterium SCGC AG-414-C22]
MAIKSIRLELLMDAGNGAQKAGDILIKALAKAGYFVFIEPIIPAEISPPKRTPYSMSGVVIRIASEEITNIGSETDFILVEHDILAKRRLSEHEYHNKCEIVIDTGFEKRTPEGYQEIKDLADEEGLTYRSFGIGDEAEALIKELSGNGKNMYYLGVLTAIFNAGYDDVVTLIKQTFKKLPEAILAKNITLFDLGFNNAGQITPSSFQLDLQKQDDNEKILLDGNTAVALGIIDAGIRLFSGYPITPASTIMHNLAQYFPKYNGILHQAEDEISALGTVLGSYFAGVPAVSATAGPGLSLKQEFLGLSLVAEIPCILVNVQRGGPSTGLPTRTEQADLMAAAFGSHGDSPKVVLGVSNVEDCFYAPHVARYLTEKLKMPVIIMSDYLTSVSYRVLDKLPLSQLDDVNDIDDAILARFQLKRLPDNIEMVKNNQANPGEKDKMRRVTGLNTSEEGFVEYTPTVNHRSHKVRNEKLHHVRRCLTEPEFFGDREGDLLIVGWGSSRGAILESVTDLQEQGYKVSGLCLKMVYPMPLMLTDIFSQFKKVVSVEVAYGDDLKFTGFCTLLRAETLADVTGLVTDATGRPLKPNVIVERALEIVR